MEALIQIVTNPIVTPLLLSLGMIGIAIEMFLPGVGVAGVVGVISFILYFSGEFLSGFADPLHILLFVGGFLLLMIELFLPAFGILAGMGILCIFSGIVLSANNMTTGLISLGVAIVLTVLVIGICIKYFGYRGIWNRFVLREQQKNEHGYSTAKEQTFLTGKQGIAITPLRPSGTARIEGKMVDVLTVGIFIETGAPVRVLEVQGSRVVVEKIENQ